MHNLIIRVIVLFKRVRGGDADVANFSIGHKQAKLNRVIYFRFCVVFFAIWCILLLPKALTFKAKFRRIFLRSFAPSKSRIFLTDVWSPARSHGRPNAYLVYCPKFMYTLYALNIY